MLRKTEGKSRRGQQRMRWLNGITDSVDMNLNKFWERVENWHAAVHAVTKIRQNLLTEQQQSFLFKAESTVR